MCSLIWIHGSFKIIPAWSYQFNLSLYLLMKDETLSFIFYFFIASGLSIDVTNYVVFTTVLLPNNLGFWILWTLNGKINCWLFLFITFSIVFSINKQFCCVIRSLLEHENSINQFAISKAHQVSSHTPNIRFAFANNLNLNHIYLNFNIITVNPDYRWNNRLQVGFILLTIF